MRGLLAARSSPHRSDERRSEGPSAAALLGRLGIRSGVFPARDPAAAARHDRGAQLVGGRHQLRPPVREQPVWMRQLCAPVLTAAISLPVIRVDGMTPAGARREWPCTTGCQPKTPMIAAGASASASGTQLIVKRTEPERTVPGPDPGGLQLMPSALQRTTSPSQRGEICSRLKPGAGGCT